MEPFPVRSIKGLHSLGPDTAGTAPFSIIRTMEGKERLMERDDAWMERTARAGIVDMAMRGWSGGAEIPMDFMGDYMTVGLSSVLAVMVAAERVGLVPLPSGRLARRHIRPDRPRGRRAKPVHGRPRA